MFNNTSTSSSLLKQVHIVSSASSIHDDDEDNYGPQLTLDINNEESCWTSSNGRPQSLTYEFYNVINKELYQSINLKRIGIVFQGGFVGQDIDIYTQSSSVSSQTESLLLSSFTSSTTSSSTSSVESKQITIPTEWKILTHIEPDDINEEQFFDIDAQDITGIRIVFNNSTDFYGRITIYRINFFGELK